MSPPPHELTQKPSKEDKTTPGPVKPTQEPPKSKPEPVKPTTEPKAPQQLSKTVVIARLQKEDVNWLQDELPNIQAAVYTVDDPTAPLHPPKNKGHEAMVYLSYLIDHYDKLPDVMIFLHSHRWAWHNNDLLQSDAVNVINALSSPYVQRQGYVNVRCHWEPGCPEWMHPLDPSTRTDISKPEEQELAKAFGELYPGRKVPETLAQPCCAQFALSKSFAQNITLARYVEIRNWLLNTPLPDEISGRIWEYLWQYLFTDEPVVCPRMDICYCDGFGICFGGEKQFTEWFDLRAEQRKLQAALGALEDGDNEEEQKSKSSDGSTQYIADELRKKIQEIDDSLRIKLEEAKKRGEDPRNRAKDCGRPWKEGDGF